MREAMSDLPRLLAQLDAGTIDKLVLTQRNQMRAVLVSGRAINPTPGLLVATTFFSHTGGG